MVTRGKSHVVHVPTPQGQIRGFNDGNMFVALTTQDQVAPLVVTQCPPLVKCLRRLDIKASWMVPLEVVYMTPLLAWNPYGVPYGVSCHLSQKCQ